MKPTVVEAHGHLLDWLLLENHDESSDDLFDLPYIPEQRGARTSERTRSQRAATTEMHAHRVTRPPATRTSLSTSTRLDSGLASSKSSGDSSVARNASVESPAAGSTCRVRFGGSPATRP